jgi:pre-rRNA-processing protein TSR3
MTQLKTIIVVHERENRAKCSVEPLRPRADFEFWTFPGQQHGPLENYMRLGLGGPLLTPADQSQGLFVLDATWRLAEKMERAYPELPVRSLLPWQTAYPRVSKMFADPATGLATIEAIYAAFLQLGRPVDGLLDAYHWREEFLAENAGLIERCRSGLSVL